MKRFITSAFAGFLMLAAAHGASAEGANIGVINIQTIMHDSLAAKSARGQLETKQKSFQAELSKKEADLQKEDQELAKQRATLAQDAFDKKLQEFRTKATAAQKEMQSKKSILDKAFGQSLSEIQKAVTDIVGEVAREKGLVIVVPSSQALYADPKLDITSEVLKKLDTKLPKLTVKF